MKSRKFASIALCAGKKQKTLLKTLERELRKEMKLSKALTWDDVLMVPQYSEIESRKEVDISTVLGKILLSTPVISSPMDTVTEADMVVAMSKAGGLGIIHRYNDINKQCDIVRTAKAHGALYIGAAVGATGDFEERTLALIDAGVDLICVDVAHGDHILMKKCLEKLKPITSEKSIHLMAGNIATGSALLNLADWGAESARLNVGAGSICSTRIQTGHGVTGLTTLLDCIETWERVRPQQPRPTLIVDGGIKTAGDMVKALALGADAIMCGSMLAGTDESPGEVLDMGGKKVKRYAGMASRESQHNWRGTSSAPEGISTIIPYKGSVSDIMEDITGNIRSGFSYSGAKNLCELRQNAQFIRQTGAGQVESSTHILTQR
jgi:IMP dehydrogenase